MDGWKVPSGLKGGVMAGGGTLARRRVVPVFLVFTGQEAFGWQRWLAPGFRHVWTMFPARFPSISSVTGFEAMIRLDPTSWGMEPDVHWTSAADAVRQCLRDGCRVVRVDAIWPHPDRRLAVRIGHCVSDAKRLLGWRSVLVQTPRQLHGLALRRGGVELVLDGERVIEAHSGRSSE